MRKANCDDIFKKIDQLKSQDDTQCVENKLER